MHRIAGHEGHCKAYHGHRYAAEIAVEAELDPLGRVIDFGIVKELVGGWIDAHWDHTAILSRADCDWVDQAVAEVNQAHGRPVYFLDAPPTAENIARELAAIATQVLTDHSVQVVTVRVWETPNCSATWVKGSSLGATGG